MNLALIVFLSPFSIHRESHRTDWKCTNSPQHWNHWGKVTIWLKCSNLQGVCGCSSGMNQAQPFGVMALPIGSSFFEHTPHPHSKKTHPNNCQMPLQLNIHGTHKNKIDPQDPKTLKNTPRRSQSMPLWVATAQCVMQQLYSYRETEYSSYITLLAMLSNRI